MYCVALDWPPQASARFDAWETGGGDGDGATWSNANPWAQPMLLPAQRIDHVLTGWPRRGGVGSTAAVALVGTDPVDGTVPSDHDGVMADLRY